MKIWFGKHQDTELSDIPSGYLRWMVEKMDPEPLNPERLTTKQRTFAREQIRDLIFAAEDELAERDET